MIHVGTSGWQYRDWRGPLYPEGLPRPRWLDHFARTFSTVEVNNSFYLLPERETFERWARSTPPGFTFAVKASRYLTHLKRLKDPREGIERFWGNATGLGGKLGPVLFQLPPRFHADLARLEAFCAELPQQILAAWEFRDRSWWIDDVFRILDDRGDAFVLPDRPGFRGPFVITGGWTYIRFHQGTRTGPDYRRDKLRTWAERVAEMEASDVWTYFNNDHGGAAVRDAIFFRESLSAAGSNVR